MKTKIRFAAALLILALALIFVSPGRAATRLFSPSFMLTRVTDLAPGAQHSSPVYMTAFDGSLYFSANAQNGYGWELWQYTNPVGIDIYVGSGSSTPAYLTVYNNALYFSANGGDGAGTELWKFDWTNGSQRVADIYSGSGDSGPTHLAVYNNELYFAANGNDGTGRELWAYGPVNGVRRVADIYSGATGSAPDSLTSYNGILYFSANGNDGTGRELWAYDPVNGARRVTDIYSGSGSSWPRYMVVYNDALYFSANGNDGAGIELWKYDPTNGPQRMTDIASGSTSSVVADTVVYKGSLYFYANGNDGAGAELWKYDPVNGAQRAADIYSGSNSSSPTDPAVFNNALYFGADGGDGYGTELWRFEYLGSAPTDISISASSLNENLPAGTTVGSLSASDPDYGDTHIFSLCGGADDASFQINGSDLLTNELFDYETKASYDICIRATDAFGNMTYDENFTIGVLDAFEDSAPTDISLSNDSVSENLPAGTTVGSFSTTDADSGDTFTFSFCGGADDASFQISNSDLLTNAVFDYETKSSYDICVRTTDSLGGLSYDKAFAVTILDGVDNFTPTDISLSGNTVTENLPPGTVIGLFSTTDPDIGDAHTYSFCGGADDASFQINVSNLESVVPFDYEAKSIYNICIRSTDNLGASYDEAFIVNVTDVTGLELILPYNGSVLHTVRPLFDWSDVANVKGYQIQVSKKINFSTTVINTTVNGAANSQYTPTKDLPVNSLLYWRVRSKISATKYGPWSVIRTFTTPNPPSVPSLVAPANGALLNGPSPLFDWNNSTVPSGVTFDHYQIQIATDNSFVNLVHDNDLSGVTNSQDNSAVLNPGQTYYWRVRAFATSGDYSAWSVMRSVKIKFPAPTLIDPQDQSSWEVQPTFTWTPVPGAPGYTIQISKSPSFGLGTISINVTLPTYTHPSAFSEGTTYYWRVRVNGIFAGDWSVVFSFIMI